METKKDERIVEFYARNPVEHHKHAVEDGGGGAWLDRNLGIILWFASASLMLGIIILMWIGLSGCVR